MSTTRQKKLQFNKDRLEKIHSIYASIVVVYFKRWVMLQVHVSHASNGGECYLMALRTMTVVRRQHFCRQHFEPLEDTVDCFLPGQCSRHHCLVPFRSNPLVDNKVQAFRVPSVGNNPLVRQQRAHETMTKNSKIWPWSWLVGTIDPHNTTGLDADADLVPNASSVQLVQVPDGVKGGRFLDGTVDPVNRHVGKLGTTGSIKTKPHIYLFGIAQLIVSNSLQIIPIVILTLSSRATAFSINSRHFHFLNVPLSQPQNRAQTPCVL
jgi:hypothetical protein